MGQLGGRDVIVSTGGIGDVAVQIWDARDMHSLDLLEGASAVALSGDGKIFVATGSAICAWRWERG